ncbi:hypothetical protein RGZ1_80 [Morganella phage vB_MmoM_Rgz1]|nr:hypothetical protein RGZ1_80 [Morganella phage vB_MmoM_Rgz1]
MFGYMKKVSYEVKEPLKVGDSVCVSIGLMDDIFGMVSFISKGYYENTATTVFVDTAMSRVVLTYSPKDEGFVHACVYYGDSFSHFGEDYDISVFVKGSLVKNLECTKTKDKMALQPVEVGNVLTNYNGEDWTVTFIPNDNTLVIERNGKVRLLNANDKSQLNSFHGLTNA